MKYDVVIIGGGWAGRGAAKQAAAAGRKVCLVTAGLTLEDRGDTPYAGLYELTKMGVSVLRGDMVIRPEWDGATLSRVHTANGLTLEAGEYILATGRFFSRGLVADMDHVYEPVFGAEVNCPSDRAKWFDPDFFAPQPFEKIGLRTTPEGNIYIDGKPAANVKATGSILGDHAGD